MFDMYWYYSLNQPPFTPSAWVFQPAWAFLYLTIFVSIILFGFKKTEKNKIYGYILFFMQLILNFCWTPVFFLVHNIILALCILILLDFIVILTIMEFYKISKLSAVVLIPYLLWILFATYLNIGFYLLN